MRDEYTRRQPSDADARPAEQPAPKLRLGQYNELTIVRFTDHGAYLDGGEVGELLLPKNYVTDDMRPGDVVRVFVYLDQSERLVGTMEKPLAVVGDFACLQVAWTNRYGAFLSWGVMKDLFVPFSEQKKTMERGNYYVVYIHIDEVTKRIVGTAKLEHYFLPAYPEDFYRGCEVDLLVWQRSDLGLKVIVNNAHSGLVYNEELMGNVPRMGDRCKGYVVNVRPDGKLDIALQRVGKGRFQDFAQKLEEELHQAGGSLPYTDHSSAEDIERRFGVSKKTFKRAVGTLYREQKIRLFVDKISLLVE